MPDLRIDPSQRESFQACACPACVAMCRHRPCWPTPADAQRLSEAGYADRLMVDWWFDRDKQNDLPADAGHRGARSQRGPGLP